MTNTKVVNLHNKGVNYDVYIGRAVPRRGLRRSFWANGFIEGIDGDRDTIIRLYEEDLLKDIERLSRIGELKGKVLGCWCAPAPCHGDVLARYADNPRLVEEAIARLKNGKEERAGVSED